MTEPTDDEILMKAMQLVKEEGKLWLWSSEELDNERDERGPFIYDSLRTEYLNQARELLRRENGGPLLPNDPQAAGVRVPADIAPKKSPA
jgi:hypothetical protein